MSTLERKKREQEQRRSAILTAARTLFAEYGIEETTMNRIAGEAELSKGTLYLYFKKKESIVYELLFNRLTELKERVLKAAHTGTTGYDKSKRILEAFSAYHHENEEYINLSRYIDYQIKSVSLADEEASRCLSVIDDLKQTAVEIIREGQQDGSVRKNIDPALTAATIVHVVESFLLKLSTRKQVVAERSQYETKKLVDHLLELMLYSLR
ncbi:MAG: TetR/AcrR family transcriptional regulator [Spirochaetia bacterium]